MKKKLLIERFQELAGIKPLYTEQSDTDDYGRSISGKDKRTFVDPKDLTPSARAEKMLDMDDDEDLTFEPEDDYVDEDSHADKLEKEGVDVTKDIGPQLDNLTQAQISNIFNMISV